MTRLIALTSLLFCFVFTACSLAPEYTRPTIKVAQNYNDLQKEKESVVNLTWWDFFQDATLKELVRESLQNNRNLQASLESVNEARALLGMTRAEQFPTVGLSASARRFDRGGVPGFGAILNNFGVSADLSYEVDFWGKYSSATKSKRLELLASEFNYRAQVITLVAQVADAYFRLAALDQQIKISERTLENRRSATKLMQSRFDQGIIAMLDVNQAEIEQADTEIVLTALQRQKRIVQNALAVLLGQPAFNVQPTAKLTSEALQLKLPAGVPAQLLERRPDVLAAEATLQAETEKIGVARAQRLPSINILGSLGLSNVEASDLGDSDSRSWNISGGLLSPLIDWGKNKSRVKAQKARAKRVMFSYEQTVLLAVNEVEDALVGLKTFEQEHLARSSQLKSAQNAAKLSRARYEEGVTPYLEVLDSERSLFKAEIGESESLQRYLSSIVLLYKSLGGGWQIDQDDSFNLIF